MAKLETENCKYFIKYIMQHITGITFLKNTPERNITVSFLQKMLLSSEAILKLNNDGFDACIIASHMAEGLLLLNFMLDNTKRIKDYEDYNIIEMLALLKGDTSHKDLLLQEIKKRENQRFLKKEVKNREHYHYSDEILLNQENYFNHWYKTEINTLSDIKNVIQTPEKKEHAEFIHDIYQKLCPYKHYAPHAMPNQYTDTNDWATRPINTAMITAMHCLYITLIYTNQFQNNALNTEDIILKYNQILGII